MFHGALSGWCGQTGIFVSALSNKSGAILASAGFTLSYHISYHMKLETALVKNWHFGCPSAKHSH